MIIIYINREFIFIEGYFVFDIVNMFLLIFIISI